MTAYILLGDGFEELEAVAIGDILRRGEIDVKYAGVSGTLITGAHGIKITADTEISSVAVCRDDCFIIPGGMGGVESIENSLAAMEKVKQAGEALARLSAICAGPRVLAKAGLLEGKTITCYPGLEHMMTGAAAVTGEPVVISGSLVTGRSPGTAVSFALALLKELGGNYKDVKAGLYCD